MSPDTNGSYVTRNELGAHIRRLDESNAAVKHELELIREDVGEIRTALGAGPRWVGARFNAILDKVLPTAIAAAAIFVLSGKL